MDFDLFVGQIDIIVVNDLIGQLGQHLFFAPANDDGFEPLAELIEVAVAEYSTLLIAAQHEMLGGKPPKWSEHMRVEKLHDGIDVFELVFQWGAGEHQSMFAGNAFDRFGRFGGEVFDALGFIENDHVRLEPRENHHVSQDSLIIGNLEQAF